MTPKPISRRQWFEFLDAIQLKDFRLPIPCCGALLKEAEARGWIEPRDSANFPFTLTKRGLKQLDEYSKPDWSVLP